jgi:hypothetical protein
VTNGRAALVFAAQAARGDMARTETIITHLHDSEARAQTANSKMEIEREILNEIQTKA